MVLAEALLRVPDSTTADKLIEDKLGQGNFLEHQPKSDALLINASAWASAPCATAPKSSAAPSKPSDTPPAAPWSPVDSNPNPL
jgi:RHH-type proline utilization regulon transcriptional repressor/proline dehydrogenase/delta 1-pyrroline-5-carboxylate dehydrogenase